MFRRSSDYLDVIATEDVQIEVQEEAGNPGLFKLYMHYSGHTVVRICKLSAAQFTLPDELVQETNPR